MEPRPKLTPRQKDVLDALRRHVGNEVAPTHAELAAELGMVRTNVTIHLATLEKKGYIRRTRAWRDIHIIEQVKEEKVTAAKDHDDVDVRFHFKKEANDVGSSS